MFEDLDEINKTLKKITSSKVTSISCTHRRPAAATLKPRHLDMLLTLRCSAQINKYTIFRIRKVF